MPDDRLRASDTFTTLLHGWDMLRQDTRCRMERQANAFNYSAAIVAGVIAGATAAGTTSLDAFLLLGVLHWLTFPLALMFINDEFIIYASERCITDEIEPRLRSLFCEEHAHAVSTFSMRHRFRLAADAAPASLFGTIIPRRLRGTKRRAVARTPAKLRFVFFLVPSAVSLVACTRAALLLWPAPGARWPSALDIDATAVRYLWAFSIIAISNIGVIAFLLRFFAASQRAWDRMATAESIEEDARMRESVAAAVVLPSGDAAPSA